MARKALIVKANRKPKFKSRLQRRCPICGRGRGTQRFFGNLCRQHIRELYRAGLLPSFFQK